MTNTNFPVFATALLLVASVCAISSPDACARKKKNVAPACPQVVTSETGFYKDVFMDSGIGLSSRTDLPSVRYLNLQMEKYIGPVKKEDVSEYDITVQNMMFVGSPLDENGVLLYPDGAPRFRVIYVNGGNAMTHSRALGQPGRDAIVNFVHAGGGYIGTCAGSFLACRYKLMGNEGTELHVDDYSPEYIGIWPGVVRNTNYTGPTGAKIEPGSPLLKYYDFGGDMFIDSLKHAGGSYGITDTLWPAGAEVLARYDISMLNPRPKRNFNDFPVIWSVKEKEEWGRVISCGSHPEAVTSGDRLHLFCAMLGYAMDGNPSPKVKATLSMGEKRIMDRMTHDNMPEYTCIGDRQYHHFAIEVPEGTDTLRVSLGSLPGRTDYDLYLFVNPDGLAFKDTAKYQNVSLGVDKTITIPAPKPGKYYISVFCDTTVDTVETSRGTMYTGRTDVLNGVPYTVGANAGRVRTD